MFQSRFSFIFTPFTCFEKVKRFISVFLFNAISKRKKISLVGKVVRVGYLQKRKKSLFLCYLFIY
jgi:hypothetical protein